MENKQDIFKFLDEIKRTGVPQREAFLSISRFLEHKARESSIPYHGHFELTPYCNLDCKMCYVHLDATQIQGRDLLPAEKWLELLRQAIDAGLASASLTGGECLTYPQFDNVYLFLKSRGIEISVLTNGILLNHDRIAFFKEHSPHLIQVSLYGNSEEVYERVTGKRFFSTVIANILEAKEAGLPVRVMITPSKYMRGAVEDTFWMVKELGIPCLINSRLITPREETGRDQVEHDLDLEDYIEIVKNIRIAENKSISPHKIAPPPSGREQEYENTGLQCAAGLSSFSLRWDGSMHPCVLMDGYEEYPLRIGFAEAWKRINDFARKYPRFKKCKDCLFSSFCRFCAAENEKLSSRYQLSARWCNRAWRMVESGLQSVDSVCEQGE